MKRLEFPLTERETDFKEDYLLYGDDIFDKPMTLDEFSKMKERSTKSYKLAEQYHKNLQGIRTVLDVSDKTDEKISINVHSRYSFPVLHKHEYIEIAYVYSGCCQHFIKNASFEMKAGDLCIISPTAMHAISVTSDDAIVVNIIMSKKHFDNSFIRIATRDYLLTRFFQEVLYNRHADDYILYPTGTDRQIHGIIEGMLAEKKDYWYNEGMRLYVGQLFLRILRKYEMMAVVANPFSKSQENHIVSVLGYLSVNFATCTLQDTADFFGYNPNYLSKLLKSYTKKSFSALKEELQMKKAAEYLLGSDAAITEIAGEVGCCDSSHFTRKFKEYYNVTPKEFRKRGMI